MATENSFEQERDRVLASLPSILTHGSGRIGNVLFTNRDGKTRVTPAPYPNSTGPAPEKVAQASKFRQLKAEVERLLQDPLRRACYEKIGARKGISAFAVLFAEQHRARSRRDRRRAEARRPAPERGQAERRNRGGSHGSSFTVHPANPSFPALGIDAILAHIPSLTPAQTEMLRAKLQESLERIEQGLREQGAGI
jgi:hypothetical protein